MFTRYFTATLPFISTDNTSVGPFVYITALDGTYKISVTEHSRHEFDMFTFSHILVLTAKYNARVSTET